MGTKLDQQFAQGVRDGVNALILEVERLEGHVEKIEGDTELLRQAAMLIREGKARFAPDTTNSHVDDFLAHPRVQELSPA